MSGKGKKPNRSGRDPEDFHIEILDFDRDRDVYDGSLEHNIISQVEPEVPAPRRRRRRPEPDLASFAEERLPSARRENLAEFKEEKLPVSPKEKARRRRNRQMTAVTYGFVALFIVMMGYLVYFNQVRARDFVRNSHNARLDSMADHVIRGPILDKDGEVLAKTETDNDDAEVREYPYGKLFSHVVGYDVKGKGGLEAAYNFELLTSHAYFVEQFRNEMKGSKNPGDAIVTTLDTDLQRAAAKALGSSKGAVVAIEPDTGKVLAMYSSPTYDPSKVEANWKSLNSDKNSALLNRATQGSYAPGSTFKVVTALEYLRENGGDENYLYDCDGSFTYSDTTIHCYNGRAHGREDLEQSVANSCNASFSNIGLHLNKGKYRETAEDLLFNRKLPGPFAAKKSRFAVDKNTGPGEMMMTAMGQGNTLVSPYHLALISSAIANDGVLMRPYIVSRVENHRGKSVRKTIPFSYRHLMKSEEASRLKTYMRSVVTQGTGKVLNTSAYEAAGKTGTAEYSSDKSKSHSTFLGFANLDDPDIAVAVVVENADTSGVSAVSIAKAVFDAYYRQ